MLWFAFKKLYLCSDEQRYENYNRTKYCCDLLSKNCIFVLTNNEDKFNAFGLPVVICFQKIVSLFWRTTKRHLLCHFPWLWFAFKKLYLCSDEQREYEQMKKQASCDLLSKNCIFVLTNNDIQCRRKMSALWFAFKKLYLCSDEQQNERYIRGVKCCDLLSKNCIFVLTNNLLLLQR